MNKAVAGLLAGIALGAFATWWLVPRGPSMDADAQEVEDSPAVATADEHDTTGVHLSADQLAHAGIVVAAPVAGKLTPELEAFGRVLDASTLTTLVAEAAAAEAMANATATEFARTEKLHADNGNASTQALETARAAVTRDRAQLAAARARLVGAWGPAIASRNDREALLNDIAMQTSALLRIDLPSGQTPSPAPTGARASLVGATNLHAVEILGPAPTTDPQMQGVAYLAIWKGDPPPVGAALHVLVPLGGKPQDVWLVPRSALIRHQGSVFVYVPASADTFARRRVVVAEPRETNVPVVEGLSAEDKIVVTGAQQLLSTELDAGGEPD